LFFQKDSKQMIDAMKSGGVIRLSAAVLISTAVFGLRPSSPAAQARPEEFRFVPGEVLVQFRANVTEAAKAHARSAIGAQLVEVVTPRGQRHDGKGDLELARIPSGLAVAAAARGLESDPAVEFAEPNWIYVHETINDPYYLNGSLWGMYGDTTTPSNQYGGQAGEAWAAGHTGSSSIYVGVIDEGIQYTHSDLAANVWTNPFDPIDGLDNDGNGFVDDVHGWDFANNDNTIYDGGSKGTLDDHGTHVTGTIAGQGGNGVGVAGVNWRVTVISGKFLGRNGGTTANAVKAVNYFKDLKLRHGLDIVAMNNSWGGGGFSQALFEAIGNAARANILFVAAAGNGGRDGVGDNNDVTPSYPSNYDTSAWAGYDAVIAVAALRSDGTLASFSNYGSNTVDLGAPGAGVYSTTAFNTYSSYSGTSMATPHVTGAIALFAASNPVRGSALKQAVLGAVTATASLSSKTTTGGRLNAGQF
jgi:thermitase